jgi:hypothetical protein
LASSTGVRSRRRQQVKLLRPRVNGGHTAARPLEPCGGGLAGTNAHDRVQAAQTAVAMRISAADRHCTMPVWRCQVSAHAMGVAVVCGARTRRGYEPDIQPGEAN